MKGNFNQIINGDKPVLVDFYAEWCGPCKVQSQILKELAPAVNQKVRIIKINVDTNPEVASRYQVRSVPTLVLFNKGVQLWKQSGVADKNILLNIINQLR